MLLGYLGPYGVRVTVRPWNEIRVAFQSSAHRPAFRRAIVSGRYAGGGCQHHPHKNSTFNRSNWHSVSAALSLAREVS